MKEGHDTGITRDAYIEKKLNQGWYENFEPKSDMKIGRLFLASRDA